ncbi:LysE/ArgO family amino acid transporter [Microlunatus parietis]|uniref:L-lysine exporter family protein LysE/ArgO n=1 Tax=Microlunatus parietis TaxID=682979 RepID=A0A7Y9I7X8_9ACTN|nr:LysE/ArgO family amino acid transporter [Microlunatus parietis]NYE71964.1 L-lysine exporter family protein LysE/ArgO [Microlunatus parietis]
MIHTAATGFGMGLSLIVAIGAQNSYLLRQAISRERAGVVAAICIASDVLLILLGISGIGVIVRQAPMIIEVLRWCGAAFLIGYGILAARRALGPQQTLDAATGGSTSATRVIITALALTWLNPHVYLDTVLLLGTVANTHGPSGRWVFGAGAIVASVLWFLTLAFAGRLLRPVFARPLTWRLLDGVIAVIMVGLAGSLIVSGLATD